MTVGVILYGPPAAGKDTVTKALHDLDRSYQHFPRLKVGGGDAKGYRVITSAELDRLRLRGEVVWENTRYGATYAVDLTGLNTILSKAIPVIHLGQPEAIAAVVGSPLHTQWVVAYLYCPRPIAVARIRSRGDSDPVARLEAWDATVDLPDADIAMDTAVMSADQAAAAIDVLVRQANPGAQAAHTTAVDGRLQP